MQKPLNEAAPDSEMPVMRHSFTVTSSTSLLRASRASVLLGSFGAIFASSQGSAETYELSEPVSSMDTFLSHNWSTPRFAKFTILAMHYNFTPAFIISAVAMMAIGVLTALGFLPLVDCEPTNSTPVEKTGFCAVVFGPVIFVVVLLTWHELAGRVGLMNARFFLDKTCIHQVDAEKKQKGILSLAAFLEKTDNMLVVYTSTYLRRLWTAFELASLLILFPEKKLGVVPTYLSRPLFAGLLVFHIGVLLTLWLRLYLTSGGIDMITIAAFFGGVFLCVGARLHVWQKQDIWRYAASFRLREAQCAVESDRKLVTRSVEAFLRQRDLVEKDASEEEAMKVFERMVQQQIPPKLLESTGASGVPYKYLLVMFSPIFFRGVDWIGALAFQGAGPGKLLFCIASQLAVAVGVLPTTSALSSLAMQATVPVEHWIGHIMRVGAWLSICLISVGAQQITSWSLQLFFQEDRRLAVALLTAFVVTVALVNVCVTCALTRRWQKFPCSGPEDAPGAIGGDEEHAALTASARME